MILALSMLSAAFTANVYAQNENVTITAADVNVKATNDGIVASAVVGFGTNKSNPTYGNAKIYKEDGIFGLSEGEYGVELIAREQRVDEPYLSFVVGDIDTSKDFYLTTNVYIGQQRDNDFIRLGTKLMKEDGSELTNGSNFQGYKFFRGNGDVKLAANTDSAKHNNAAYEGNNWINYTIAGTNGVIAVYVDGVKFEGGWVSGISGGNKTVSYSGILKDVNPSIRLSTLDSNLGGVPSFAVFKDAKLVYGTYNADASKAAVTSSTYTVTYEPVKLGTGQTAAKSSVTGVSSSETAAEFLANITAPAGGSVSVIKIDNDTKKTIQVSGTEYMSDDMILLAKSADGSMKLYDIDVSLSGAIYVDSTGYTQSGYSIDENGKTITLMPHTTVETVKNVIKANEGVTYKVVTASGKEVTSGAITDTMKLVASKGTATKEYSFIFKNTTAYDAGSRLSVVDETKVFEASGMTTTYDYTGKGLLGLNHSSAGYNQLENANPKVTPSGSYVVTKTNMPGHTDDNRVNAWHFKDDGNATGWRKHSSNALGLHASTKAEHGKKTIISFKVNMKEGSGFSFAPRHAFGTKPDCTDIQYLNTPNTGTGDRITFSGNNIILGGQNRDWGLAGYTGNYIENISTYQNDKEYDVVLIESRGTTEIDGTTYPTVVTEAVYVDGVNIIENVPRTFTIKDGRDYFGIRDITFQTIGECYVGGLKIYMADEYSIPAEEEEENPGEGEEPELADLTITTDAEGLEIYTADPLANNMATVKGYTGNVGDLKEAIDSDINTRLEVLDRTATSVLSDNVALSADMYVKVSDVNNSENYKLYVLSDILNEGAFAASENGNVITVTRTFKAYKTENKTVKVIIASYDSTGKLIDVDLDEKTITNKGTYNFEVSADKSDSVNIMMWDGALKPYNNVISAFDLIAD